MSPCTPRARITASRTVRAESLLRILVQKPHYQILGIRRNLVVLLYFAPGNILQTSQWQNKSMANHEQQQRRATRTRYALENTLGNARRVIVGERRHAENKLQKITRWMVGFCVIKHAPRTWSLQAPNNPPASLFSGGKTSRPNRETLSGARTMVQTE